MAFSIMVEMIGRTNMNDVSIGRPPELQRFVLQHSIPPLLQTSLMPHPLLVPRSILTFCYKKKYKTDSDLVVVYRV